MWLINTTTFELKSFTPPNIPQYAILSHTWGDEEVSFQEFNHLEKAKTKSGFSKIKMTCQLARESGIEYAWVDTCCIDKSSSAELSESINSMYSWYRKSKICYAYVNDWPQETGWADLSPLDDGVSKSGDSTHDTSFAAMNEKSDQPGCLDSGAGFAKTAESALSGHDSKTSLPPLKWFTRGWTLQELIAPTTMKFYDQTWNLKGSKSDPVVVQNLCRVTGITHYVLEDGSERRLRSICLGQRMSWAAHRETSRIEDIAYCLLGVFQVNMPLVYGEGDKAFLRLQEEIIKFSTDLSIFGWTQSPQDVRNFRGILSCHPREFAGLGNCVLIKSPFFQADEVAMTNRGLRIHTSLFDPHIRPGQLSDFGSSYLSLGCIIPGFPQGLGISLHSMGNSLYLRIARANCFVKIGGHLRCAEARSIYIARDWDHDADYDYADALITGLEVQFAAPEPYTFKLVEAWPPGLFEPLCSTIVHRNLTSFLGFFRLAVIHRNPFSIVERPIVEFIAVYCSQNGIISVRLLQGNQAESFANYTKTIWNMDPITAQVTVSAHFWSIYEQSMPDMVVTDSSTELRISANTGKGIRYTRDRLETIIEIALYII